MMWIILLALGGVAAWQIAMHTGAGAKRLECPSCDLYIMGARPSRGESVLCPHCREFALHDGKTIVKVPPDFVAPTPIFCAELPMGVPKWPPTCCMCNEPATRGVTLKLYYEQDAAGVRDMATQMASLGLLKTVETTTISLDVPHCAQHENGAALKLPYEREQPNFGLAFRSYPHYLQFKQLNRSTPRRASLFAGQLEEV